VFEKIGMFATLMRQMPKIKEELAQFQQRLGAITAEGEAGGGAVKAKVNGLRQVVRVWIADDALRDKELLEDLVASAVNQASEKVQDLVGQESAKMAGNLGLPTGIELPGLG